MEIHVIEAIPALAETKRARGEVLEIPQIGKDPAALQADSIFCRSLESFEHRGREVAGGR